MYLKNQEALGDVVRHEFKSMDAKFALRIAGIVELVMGAFYVVRGGTTNHLIGSWLLIAAGISILLMESRSSPLRLTYRVVQYALIIGGIAFILKLLLLG